MLKLFIVSRMGAPIGHFLTADLAKGFAAECERIAPQAHMSCTVAESHISTYGMPIEQSRKLIAAVNNAIM